MNDSRHAAIARIAASVIIGLFILASAREIKIGLESSALHKPVRDMNQLPPPQPAAALPQPRGDASKLKIDGSPVEGRRDAPVTMIECSDFQCPFCARFADDTLVELRDHEIKDGEVRLVFKNFPLSGHQYAEKAAEAAECAHMQGKFWQMHDLLFHANGRLDSDSLKSYARQIGLDTKKFDHCLATGETAGMVHADKSQCSAAGVQGTPSFFINGKMLVGAQPYDQFRSLIEQGKNREK